MYLQARQKLSQYEQSQHLIDSYIHLLLKNNVEEESILKTDEMITRRKLQLE